MANNRTWHLVARKLSGEASLDELRELESDLLNDPDLAYQVELYTSYFENPRKQLRDPLSKQQSWNKTKAKIASEFPSSFTSLPEISSRIPSLKKSIAIAASILLIITIGSIYYFNSRPVPPNSAGKPVVNEMKTMPGTRSKMVLPDGTIVWLNSDSYISFNPEFGKTKREIYLSGEAFFDVFHNPEIPMTVHARTVNIVVKGTAFNVRSYPDAENVETSLIRGSVELSTTADPERKILLKPNEKITIDTRIISTSVKLPGISPTVPTQKPAYYHIDMLKESALSKTIPEVSWVQNKLVFDNESFADISKKMGKWYNVDFVLSDQALSAKKFSGSFDRESLYESLSALQILHHFDFTIERNKVIIK